jgi:hypothetical protein
MSGPASRGHPLRKVQAFYSAMVALIHQMKLRKSIYCSCCRRNVPPMTFRLLLKMFLYSLVKYVCGSSE